MCLFLYKKLNLRPNQISQWIFANLGDLSLIPGPTRSKKKTDSCELSSANHTRTHVRGDTHTTLHIHAHKMNK